MILEKGVLIPAAFAVAAASLYLAALTSKERALTGDYATARVLTAAVDVPERTTLTPAMLTVSEIPRKFVAQDAVEVRTPSDARLAAGLIARVRIPKGNQVGQSELVPPSPGAGLAVKVPLGYRGAALAVPPETARLVKPGDRVDVLVTFDAVMADGRREKATATILQNILVLAVGSDLGPGLGRKSDEADARTAILSDKTTLSLALNSIELQYLALAQKQGETTIGVRALGDTEMHVVSMVTLGGLLSDGRR